MRMIEERLFHSTISFDRVAHHGSIPALIRNLPRDVQRETQKAYRLFQTNPAHPSVQFKKLEGENNIYSARIGLGYRALAGMKRNRIIWYWIGTHNEYDRLV